MKQSMTATLYGALDSRADQNRYTYLWLGAPVYNEKEQGAKGIDMMKMKCDPEVYDSLCFKNYPCEVQVEFILTRGGQSKITQKAVAVLPARQPASVAKS
ncbi:hypothetical protein [Oceanobacter sp. 3_MG-2023]|uniref:hypothetical protein n=1 Tax=Oceanobacter sp. 3_MG-2023 TaxID=3062622 RepID=UPI0027361346|nr:hypothetical protein [Oceanobacter sp. 3_MG-2023]MDP2506719.1 hypothetical protein [Oceanobacter sp. 3_MG-2023]